MYAGRGASIYAARGRCVYASGGCIYAAGAYMHPGVYTRVGAYTRTVGVYTQGVCIRTPSRIHRFLRIYAPPTASLRRNRRTVMLMDEYRVDTKTETILHWIFDHDLKK